MTPAQMRRMIVTKYNEPTREGHRVDLVSTTPYVIVVDEDDRAQDVEFPRLTEGRSYRVAISDYAYKNYRGLDYADGAIRDEEVAEVLIGQLEARSPLVPDNRARQSVARE